ncbi:DMT family transporter [Paenibacillus beijingensis]|uniref:Quaternary ammonium transporter n=1 Tax=Paenibacillus beijingensis TaxID=1126833 RepID=A0A0D5NH48_9BACL|nr:multidrug efflux SMR transporter [Paenibacillus beijingensis]AJY74233.1 quaternary ammonium transporter [Paenibacillus beijingensis]
MAYLFLAISIVSELVGTSMLKASQGFTRLLPVLGMIVSFTCAFFFLSLSLKTIPLNAAYAIWSGIGAIATVVISVLIWKERINTGSIIGIALIVVGVVILNLFGPGHGGETADSSRSEQLIAQKK